MVVPITCLEIDIVRIAYLVRENLVGEDDSPWTKGDRRIRNYVPRRQLPDNFPYQVFPAQRVSDSDTHPYASVAGSEVRLVMCLQ